MKDYGEEIGNQPETEVILQKKNKTFHTKGNLSFR